MLLILEILTTARISTAEPDPREINSDPRSPVSRYEFTKPSGQKEIRNRIYGVFWGIWETDSTIPGVQF